MPLAVAVRPAVTTAGLVAAYYLLPMDSGFTDEAAVGLVLGLLGVLALFLWHIRAIRHSPYPKLRGVEALSTTVVFFVLLFAAAYHLLELAEPGSFNEFLTRTDSLYFTLTVFSTTGFGDITARSQSARLMVSVQMAVGLLLVGVAARVLVNAVQGAVRRRGEAGGPPDAASGRP
ncbi:potassium channel family protein [Streptomyces sp. NPDC059506]|uniref:potassium channel family protein n=1 Tax=Streptomyces sp. NPDC059506 TaxID=3347751 RepID=UPI003697D563